MKVVRLPSKISQIDRFPTEWAMDLRDEEDREKGARPETSAPASLMKEIGYPVRQTARTEPEFGPAA